MWFAPFVHSFIHSFHDQIFIKNLLVPGTVLDAGDIVVSKKDKKIPASMELTL